MACISEAFTITEVNGRIRFRIPQIRWSPNHDAGLKNFLRDLPGSYHSKACVHTGTAAIYYNWPIPSRETREKTIHHYLFPKTEEHKPKTPSSIHIKERENILETGLFQHDHFIWFDLLEHGILVGGESNGIGEHFPLKMSAMIGYQLLIIKIQKNPIRRENKKNLHRPNKSALVLTVS